MNLTGGGTSNRVLRSMNRIAICCFLGATLCAATGFGQEALNKKELREQAKEMFGPLPDKMPGAEKDNPHLVKLGGEAVFREAAVDE